MHVVPPPHPHPTYGNHKTCTFYLRGVEPPVLEPLLGLTDAKFGPNLAENAVEGQRETACQTPRALIQATFNHGLFLTLTSVYAVPGVVPEIFSGQIDWDGSVWRRGCMQESGSAAGKDLSLGNPP